MGVAATLTTAWVEEAVCGGALVPDVVVETVPSSVPVPGRISAQEASMADSVQIEPGDRQRTVHAVDAEGVDLSPSAANDVVWHQAKTEPEDDPDEPCRDVEEQEAEDEEDKHRLAERFGGGRGREAVPPPRTVPAVDSAAATHLKHAEHRHRPPRARSNWTTSWTSTWPTRNLRWTRKWTST